MHDLTDPQKRLLFQVHRTPGGLSYVMLTGHQHRTLELLYIQGLLEGRRALNGTMRHHVSRLGQQLVRELERKREAPHDTPRAQDVP